MKELQQLVHQTAYQLCRAAPPCNARAGTADNFLGEPARIAFVSGDRFYMMEAIISLSSDPNSGWEYHATETKKGESEPEVTLYGTRSWVVGTVRVPGADTSFPVLQDQHGGRGLTIWMS